LQRPTHKKPPIVDTAIAALVESYDSPSWHIKETEETVASTDVFTTNSVSECQAENVTPQSVQRFFYLCPAAGPSLSIVTPEKNLAAISPKVKTSFTEATDDQTCNSMGSQEEMPDSYYGSFFDCMIDRLFGAVEKANFDDENTTLISAQAKYDDFFSLESPVSEASLPEMISYPQKNEKRTGENHNVNRVRSTLLDDLLDHVAGNGMSKYGTLDDDTLVGASNIGDYYHLTRSASRKILSEKKMNSHQSVLPPTAVRTTRRSKSALGNIVDQILNGASTTHPQIPRPSSWIDATSPLVTDLSFPFSIDDSITTATTVTSTTTTSTSMDASTPQNNSSSKTRAAIMKTVDRWDELDAQDSSAEDDYFYGEFSSYSSASFTSGSFTFDRSEF
jgi:hypothetical protein